MRLPLALISLATFAVSACSNNVAGPSGYIVSGSYSATTLTTTQSGSTTDQLAAGSSIRLVLAADGTTSGRLLVPASGGGAATDADLTGTWTLQGEVVTLQQTADTFLKDMPLTVRDGLLSGDRTFGVTRVKLTLTRQ